MTHTGNVSVPRGLDLRLFDPTINDFSRLMVELFYIKFGYPSCMYFLRYRAEKHTNWHANT